MRGGDSPTPPTSRILQSVALYWAQGLFRELSVARHRHRLLNHPPRQAEKRKYRCQNIAMHQKHTNPTPYTKRTRRGRMTRKRSIQRWHPTSPTGQKSLTSQAISSTKPFAVMERMSRKCGLHYALKPDKDLR